MLNELRIRDLAIIDRLDLTFGPGFNVLTGETGAGKSIIIDAVNLLLGDRASQEIVRAGAERTEVEGRFHLGPAVVAKVAPLLTEHGLEGDQGDEVILAREVRVNGRSVARVNGRAVTTALLSEIANLLVDVHGQGEHLSLLHEREHINLLDRYAGLDDGITAVAELVGRVRDVRRELESLRQDERERARRIDLLSYQVEEIGSTKLKEGEEEDLDAERRRLANAEQLSELSGEAGLLLSGADDGQPGVLDALGSAEQSLARLARIDQAAAPLLEQLGEATALLDDISHELTHYRDAIEFNPRRLEQVEERLHLIHSLQRKYGDTINEVLRYAERAAAELETISHAEERIGQLAAKERQLLADLGRQGAELSEARRAAGDRMAQAIEAELADLQMVRARFAVSVQWTPDPTGAIVDLDTATRINTKPDRYAFNLHGLDAIAFLVSANPGEPLRPLAKVASGGETSRLMLALKTVLGRADETPTLIFDEIDQGIGGRVGGTVGLKLWGLTVHSQGGAVVRGQGSETRPSVGDKAGANLAGDIRHQVLCITHLPQLAAYGDLHYHVIKHVNAGRTTTEIHHLTNDSRITELARMMGADTDAGRVSVAEMMADVAVRKSPKK